MWLGVIRVWGEIMSIAKASMISARLTTRSLGFASSIVFFSFLCFFRCHLPMPHAEAHLHLLCVAFSFQDSFRHWHVLSNVLFQVQSRHWEILLRLVSQTSWSFFEHWHAHVLRSELHLNISMFSVACVSWSLACLLVFDHWHVLCNLCLMRRYLLVFIIPLRLAIFTRV